MERLRLACVLCAIAMCQDAAAQYDVDGLQELAKTIWPGGPGVDAMTGPLDALDAMLVVLNSRKLHRRQAPPTCPYCPTGYPCAIGCPTVPAVLPPSNCAPAQCTTNPPATAEPGPPGPPGPPGNPGMPIYRPGFPGCPGSPGVPGPCLTGEPGPPGYDGNDGRCQGQRPIVDVDVGTLHRIIAQHLSCPGVTRCRYTIDALLLRLHRLEGRFSMLHGLKERITQVEDQMAAHRASYLAKRMRGTKGEPGPLGMTGIKGLMGYEGHQGMCVEPSTTINLQSGEPGVQGPKGDPGPAGDKVCNCDGLPGDSGVSGPSLVGLPGTKGYKGAKGMKGATRWARPSPTSPPLPPPRPQVTTTTQRTLIQLPLCPPTVPCQPLLPICSPPQVCPQPVNNWCRPPICGR